MLGDRIRERRTALDLTQEELAELMGYKSRSTINKIELNINDIPLSKLNEFAEVLRTTPAYLMGWDDEPYDYDADIDGRTAGLGGPMWDYFLDIYEGDVGRSFRAYMQFEEAKQEDAKLEDHLKKLPSVHTTKGFSIPVLGPIAAGLPIDAIEDIIGYEDITRDMAESGTIYGLKVKGHSMEPRIWEGDIVILRWQSDVESGDIAAILVNGEEVTLKKVHKNEQGITLIALNPSVYSPHFYTNQEIEDLPVSVVGKVLEVRGTL